MIKEFKRRKTIYISLVITIITMIFYILYISYHINIGKQYEELLITAFSDLNGRTINIGDVNWNIDLYLPKWDSFWNDLSRNIYGFVGYSSSLIIDVLQVGILFLTGTGLINLLIFQPNNNDTTLFSSFFWKLYLIAFIVYFILIIYFIYKTKKNNGTISGEGKIKKLFNGFLLVFSSVIVVPLGFILIDIAIYLIFILLFPFMFNLLFGLDIYDNTATLGKYTLSSILFNSSFKTQMGSYIFVPTPEVLFPGDTYLIDFSLTIPNWDIVLFQNSWKYTVNGKNQQVIDSMNFFLFYLSEIVVITLLFMISIKVTKQMFELFILFITSPLYFSTIATEENKIKEWIDKTIKSSKTFMLTTSLFLIFTLTFPVIITGISNQEIDTFREVNWMGMVNIIVIITGLYLTINIEKIFGKVKSNSNIQVIGSGTNLNSSNTSGINEDDYIFELRRAYE